MNISEAAWSHTAALLENHCQFVWKYSTDSKKGSFSRILMEEGSLAKA